MLCVAFTQILFTLLLFPLHNYHARDLLTLLNTSCLHYDQGAQGGTSCQDAIFISIVRAHSIIRPSGFDKMGEEQYENATQFNVNRGMFCSLR